MPLPQLGVVIVTFNSADVILDCLESLLASTGVTLRIVVVDNGSTDDTIASVRSWAAGETAYHPEPDIPFDLTACPKPVALDSPTVPEKPTIRLIASGINSGFAAGVNKGLAVLATEQDLDRFWILNPDSVVPRKTALAFATYPQPSGGFALMGGRVLYLDQPNIIQIDGGTIDRRTGVTGNLGLSAAHVVTPPPNPEQIAFITGASMVASRTFYETAGAMPEDYFLYYEEVDWALRRGNLPLVYCADGIIYHRAGTAIGSPTLGRPASPFSLYFKHRGRLRFMRRHYRRSLALAYTYSVAKAAQLFMKGFPTEAMTILRASLDLPPSPSVRAKLSPRGSTASFRKMGTLNRHVDRQSAKNFTGRLH